MQLATEQIQVVAQHLQNSRINPGLQEELLDHLCCDIEAEIAAGHAFEAALQQTLARWNQGRLRQLNNSLLITKYRPMFLRATAAVAVLAAFLWLNPFKGTSVDLPLPTATTVATTTIPTPTTNPALALLSWDVIDRPTASPLRGVALTDAYSGFGMRRHPISKKMVMHRGVDLVAPLGTPVYATADGRVIFAGRNGDNGIQVRIAHLGGYVTVYNHLQEEDVERYQDIRMGVQIGTVGSTGASTGPHLHYEIWKDDKAIDPC